MPEEIVLAATSVAARHAPRASANGGLLFSFPVEQEKKKKKKKKKRKKSMHAEVWQGQGETRIFLLMGSIAGGHHCSQSIVNFSLAC